MSNRLYIYQYRDRTERANKFREDGFFGMEILTRNDMNGEFYLYLSEKGYEIHIEKDPNRMDRMFISLGDGDKKVTMETYIDWPLGGKAEIARMMDRVLIEAFMKLKEMS